MICDVIWFWLMTNKCTSDLQWCIYMYSVSVYFSRKWLKSLMSVIRSWWKVKTCCSCCTPRALQENPKESPTPLRAICCMLWWPRRWVRYLEFVSMSIVNALWSRLCCLFSDRVEELTFFYWTRNWKAMQWWTTFY